MYYYVNGNIFESPAQTLVNTVNTVGAMGKGIAREFKRLFPEMFKEYQSLCESKVLQVGKLWLYQTEHKWVLNFPTKRHWREPSMLEYIESGLQYFVTNYTQMRINSIAFPRLGCGNGELEWEQVKPLMESILKRLPIDIYVYEVTEYAIPEHKDLHRMREWLQKEPEVYPFVEFKKDIVDLVSKEPERHDSDGEKFSVDLFDDMMVFRQHQKQFALPFEGDETGPGLQEMWQFFREKQICTSTDLLNMGYDMTFNILDLLADLPYVQKITLNNERSGTALQLKPNSKALTPLLNKDMTYQPQLL